MLRKVIFNFDEDTMTRLRGPLQRLSQDIKAHGTEAVYNVCGRKIQQSEAQMAEECQDEEKRQRGCQLNKEILYLTDLPEEYSRLRQQGWNVLPYRYAANREEAFDGAEYVIEQIEDIDYEVIDMVYRRMVGLPWEILRTKRCIVRETIEEDVDGLYAIYAEPAITEYMEGLYHDRDEEMAYIQDYRRRMYGFYGYGIWTILSKQDGQVIGRAGINWREGFDIPELGFVIGVPWQRKGYAYEVCSEILNYARDEIGFKQMQALVREHNEKSCALCRKLGFVEDGITVLERERYILYRKELV